MFQAKVVEIANNKNIIFNGFFSENRDVYEVMQKHFVHPDIQPMTKQYGARALHAV